MGPTLILYAVPFFLFTVLLESYIVYKMHRDYVEAKDSMTSIGLGLGNLGIGFVTKAITFGASFYVYNNWKLFDLGQTWPVWVLAFLGEDLTYYWVHRISHEIRFYWASHMVHHSSPKYNLAAALRQTWTGNLSGGFVFWLWLPLIGVHPFIVMFFQQTSLLYQYWIHTELINKMPRWFEYILNTPSHHRVHHGTDLDYLDTNYAGVLIIWDRMFGSFVTENQRPNYGLTKQIESYNPAKIAFYEWVQMFKDVANAKSVKAVFGYIFGPPGWSDDGSRLTVTQMREQQKK
jgi:sterol desaturase/sphingolipid hydroxylase (fatty acid hydroxylase superfamily)